MNRAGPAAMMLFMPDVPPLDPDPAQYTYVQVTDHVTARVAAAELSAGDKLMGEREMAEHYGVAVATVRRAVQELRNRGAVRTLPGKGTFIA